MRYKAFISYSHKDERWGARLHKRLETFTFPKRVIGQATERGPVPENVKPIFRDKVELSAGANLSEALQRRLVESENLIVLCSPRAVASHWVNEEILFFKRHNNSDNIFAFIIDGEPYADKPEEECFPPALRFELDDQGELTDIPAEPLAADARKQGEGPRMALLQVLSGMAGLGLDDLVRRDLQRARRRVTGITVGAIAAMLVMGTLTGIALEARGEAEARKDDAEGLIEFMLTDLKDKLEPVGRLDALDAVGQRASDYYDQYDLDRLDADSVGRYAQVNHLIGDIQLRMGNISEAKKYFDPVYETTKRQLGADPKNPDRIYEHIQSVFWVAQPLTKTRDFEGYLDFQKQYLELAKRLVSIEGNTNRSIQEMAYGFSNVGKAYYELGDYDPASDHYLKSLKFYSLNVKNLSSIRSKLELSYRYTDIANLYYQMGDVPTAFEWIEKRAGILNTLINNHPKDYSVRKAVIWLNLNYAFYHEKFEQPKKAKEYLYAALADIRELKSIEPNDDELLRGELDALGKLISISRQTNQSEAESRYIAQYEERLFARLNARTTFGFDPEWDYSKPLQHVKQILRASLGKQDIGAIQEILPLYEDLINQIKDRPGYKENARKDFIHFATFKTLFAEDLPTYDALQTALKNPEFEIGYKSFDPFFRLINEKYCVTYNRCDPTNRKFSEADLEAPHFSLFQKLHPNIAHNIEKNIKASRR